MSIVRTISTVRQIAQYSKKTLIDGIYKSSPKNFVKMQAASTPESIVTVPLTCFSRTKKGDIVLYRGLGLERLLSNKDIHYAESVAASAGINVKDVLSAFGKRTKKTIREIANFFSGLTQGNDPILHTTTKRKIAKRFAKDGGVLVEYHVPKKFLEQRGFIGHLGEDEIDFFYKIPKKYVAKVTCFKEPAYHKNTITINNIPAKVENVLSDTSTLLPPPPPEVKIVL